MSCQGMPSPDDGPGAAAYSVASPSLPQSISRRSSDLLQLNISSRGGSLTQPTLAGQPQAPLISDALQRGRVAVAYAWTYLLLQAVIKPLNCANG